MRLLSRVFFDFFKIFFQGSRGISLNFCKQYSTFRESCQSSDCTKIEREICATCILTKTRSAPSVRGPPKKDL
nr:MAG TPA: hypothetical protein [Caudoviricetes sp.]